MEMKSLTVRKLSTGSIYKLTLLGLVFGFVPLFLLMGVLAAFGMADMTWNEQPVTGFPALLVGPLMGVLLALMFTALIGSVMALGLWIFSLFRPITVEYRPLPKDTSPEA